MLLDLKDIIPRDLSLYVAHTFACVLNEILLTVEKYTKLWLCITEQFCYGEETQKAKRFHYIEPFAFQKVLRSF